MTQGHIYDFKQVLWSLVSIKLITNNIIIILLQLQTYKNT